MQNKYKILAAIVAIIAAGHIMTGTERTVSSQGVCQATVKRDKFAITLQIKALAPNAAESLRQVQSVADEVARGIMTLADDTTEMQTKNIFSFEKSEWHNNSQRNLGVESQIDLEITTNNRETINAVVNQTQNVQNGQVFPRDMRNFTSKHLVDKATADCLSGAIKDAREKARAMASGGRARVGRMISAEFQNARTDSPIAPRMMAMAADAGSSGDYLQSADGEITIRVNATFRLR